MRIEESSPGAVRNPALSLTESIDARSAMSLPEVFHQYQLPPRLGYLCEDD